VGGVDLDASDFVDAMARRLSARVPSLTRIDALRLALIALDSFLENDKVEFGDARYDWSEAGAITLAEEELWYWS
jgi:hypothetical protein